MEDYAYPFVTDLDGDGVVDLLVGNYTGNLYLYLAETTCGDGIEEGAETCDGQIDEGLAITYYYDGDNDGYGTSDNTRSTCHPNAGAGYIEISGDCDDADNSANPGATETCGDGTDQDCDGLDLACVSETTTDDDADGILDTLDDSDGDGVVDADDLTPTVADAPTVEDVDVDSVTVDSTTPVVDDTDTVGDDGGVDSDGNAGTGGGGGCSLNAGAGTTPSFSLLLLLLPVFWVRVVLRRNHN